MSGAHGYHRQKPAVNIHRQARPRKMNFRDEFREEQGMEAPEIVETTDRSVRCDGGGGALGHPAVYLNMGDKDSIDCPYCGCRFVLGKAAASAH